MSRPLTCLMLCLVVGAGSAGCGRDHQEEAVAQEPTPVDCATADTTELSMFVKDPFKRDLAIDTEVRVAQHLADTPALVCLTLTSDHGELPVIAYATAHRPDAAYIYPLLVEWGADPADALPVAVYLGKTRALPWLLERVDPNSGDALIIAASKRRGRILEQLLAAGADVNRKASTTDFQIERGKTALHYAARAGREDMVETLIRAGASVNAMDARSQPPLHDAVAGGDAGTIALLYEWGAVPSLLNPADREALRRIARRYRMERLLAELG